VLHLLKEIDVPKGVDSLSFDILHDDFVEVWVNGVENRIGDWYTKSHYRVVQMSRAAQATLKPGKNLVAVRVRNNAGGLGYFDMGVTALQKVEVK
jgi:hypothetical protein